jgi:hypothetical protein
MATISAKRRPIRDDAERKNEFTCRILRIPWGGSGKQWFREHNHTGKMAAPRTPVEGAGKNSNAAIAQWLIHSGFVAAIRPGTVELFYPWAGRI